MCREEALKVWKLEPELKAMGVKLVCLLHENLPEEVAAFKPAFWPGELYLDKDLAFFAALGEGKPRQLSMLSLLNPFGQAMKNYGRSKKTVSESNLTGNGLIGGGFMLITPDKGCVYAFKEKTFGDHAPVEDILAAAKAHAK